MPYAPESYPSSPVHLQPSHLIQRATNHPSSHSNRLFRMNIFALSAFVLATLHMTVLHAFAHGYVSQPPSRQVLCRDDNVPNCGDVKYEPQSVEALKGSFSCNGDGARFPQLNDESLWVNYFTQVHPGSAPLSFTWTLTAPHATTTWEYFLLTEGHTLLASYDEHGHVPDKTVTHQVSLAGYTGRQTVLARWNIADTANAFYACVDLSIVPTNTASAVGAAFTQQPIAIPFASGVKANGSSSAGTASSSSNLLMSVQNGFVIPQGSS